MSNGIGRAYKNGEKTGGDLMSHVTSDPSNSTSSTSNITDKFNKNIDVGSK